MKRSAGDSSPKSKKAKTEVDRESDDAHFKHRRTLRFAVSVAASLCFPDRRLQGGHSVGEAYWYDFVEGGKATKADVTKLGEKVDELVKKGSAIERETVTFARAIELLTAQKQPVAVKLLETRVSKTVDMYKCEGQYRMALVPLWESLGGLATAGDYVAKIQPYTSGFVAIYGSNYTEQPSIAESIAEHCLWGKDCTGVTSIGDLNLVTIEGSEQGRKDFILQAEFRQEQKLTKIAEMVHARNQSKDATKHVRVLAIAGPTSSGKTTFAHKLSLYLKNYGYPSKALSVDHYYLSIADQPQFIKTGRREDVDYDSIESMDVKLINEHINSLIAGNTVLAPNYNFKSGNREGGHDFTLPPKGILVIEGIHALNPEYTAGIPKENVFRIYISPLTGLLVDDFNALKTTSHRLMRRMTRDYLFRGYSAQHTISKWSQVRRGEHKYIFAHQNNADFVMNSAMEFELPVLKTYVEPLIRCVQPSKSEYERAEELKNVLSLIAAWPENDVPLTSIFREFIGNGAFDKH